MNRSLRNFAQKDEIDRGNFPISLDNIHGELSSKFWLSFNEFHGPLQSTGRMILSSCKVAVSKGIYFFTENSIH